MKQWICMSVILLLASAAVSCSKEEALARQEEVPPSYFIESENYYVYQDGMQCAVFASAYLLRHFGEAAEGMDIFGDFPNRAPGGGIFPEGIGWSARESL